MTYDWFLYALLAVFIAWEAVAHYALNNERGHTLSDRIKWLEGKGGIPVRVVVVAACIALAVHLQGAF